jgi:hypothetical protein
LSEEFMLELAAKIAAAEEGARLAAIQRVQVEVPPAPPTFSRVIRLTDVRIPETIVEEPGCGCLKELVIRSGDASYILRVYADGLELYHNSYTWFKNISQTVEEIDAFEEDGTYTLRLSDIHFTKGIKIIAEPAITTLTAAQKLEEVFCKIDLAKP